MENPSNTEEHRPPWVKKMAEALDEQRIIHRGSEWFGGGSIVVQVPARTRFITLWLGCWNMSYFMEARVGVQTLANAARDAATYATPALEGWLNALLKIIQEAQAAHFLSEEEFDLRLRKGADL